MEKLHGSRNSVSYGFAKSQSNNRVTLFGQTWQIDENMIAEVTGLKTEGTKFYRDQMYAAEAFKNFPKLEDEKGKLAKKDNISYYTPQQVKPFWQKVLRALMDYLTVDGRFTKIYNYHFSILNHFCHGAKISLPFYLASSLNESLADHAKKPNSYPLAHQGLILIIYEHLKDKGRATKDDPLIINTHISKSCKDSDSNGDQPSTPTHKKRKVETEHEEKDKDTDTKMEQNKDEKYGEGEEGGNSENSHSNPKGSESENDALNPKEYDNPNSDETEQGSTLR